MKNNALSGFSILTARQHLAAQLSPISDTPSLDAQVLLAHLTGEARPWLLAHPEALLTPEQETALYTCLARLLTGEPLPYVLGHWEFFGLDFFVSPAALIPRPETELLVQQALSWLRQHPRRRLVADVGTGSGCIAVSLAAYQSDLHIIASDQSPAALKLARANAVKHTVEQHISFVRSDLIAPFYRFDMIGANLPYVPTSKLGAPLAAQGEPRQALDGGQDGLDLIRRLLRQAPDRLAPGGLLLMEIEAYQGAAALELALTAFPRAQVRLLTDLAGHDRLILVEN